MFVLGITGGVGAGKSMVLTHLKEKYSAYVLEADALAKRLMEPGEPLFDAVVSAFGEEILTDGAIDRQRMAGLVFSDADKLECLNAIVHPGVKKYILRDIEEKKTDGHVKLYVIEAALLIQDGYDEICDELWYIHADEDTRVARIMESRGYSKERCEGMLKSQPDAAYFQVHTACTIDNSRDFSDTAAQIRKRLNLIGKSGIIPYV